MELKAYHKTLYDQLMAVREKHQVPGAAISLIIDGEQITSSDGVLNVNNPVPVDGNALFQIASITKTFNALLVRCFKIRDG